MIGLNIKKNQIKLSNFEPSFKDNQQYNIKGYLIFTYFSYILKPNLAKLSYG
jgi:hypothetical protein